MDIYPWIVVAHVFLVIVSFGAHGVSAFAMFRAKSETDRARIAAVLDLSTTALIVAGIGLLLAVLFGIIAAVMHGWFSQAWPWASIVVVVVVWISMTPMAATRMGAVRGALGLPTRSTKKGDVLVPGTDADLAAAQARLMPVPVAALGVGAIAVLVWLMELKPF